MKYVNRLLIFWLVIGMVLSSCNSQPNNKSGAQTATVTSAPTKIGTNLGPMPSVPSVLSSTAAPLSDEIEETEPTVLEISHTEANPLTDLDEIQEILDRLQEREAFWFSRPGWYSFTRYLPSGYDYMRTQYALAHVS